MYVCMLCLFNIQESALGLRTCPDFREHLNRDLTFILEAKVF